MDYVQTFENFTGSNKNYRGAINEKKDHGDLSDVFYSDDTQRLFKLLKKGDTFTLELSGVDLDYVEKNQIGKKAELGTGSFGRGAGTFKCEVLAKRKARFEGGMDELDPDEPVNAIYFSIEGEDGAFVITDFSY